jgi:hypothetical protein
MSDPFARIMAAGPKGVLYEIGRTEAIQNSHEPAWTTTLQLAFRPEETQKLLFQVACSFALLRPPPQ